MYNNTTCRRCTPSISPEEHCERWRSAFECRDAYESTKAVKTPLNGLNEKEPNATPPKVER
ncbi:MAG: hypothetical protein FWC75_09475 [Oscillospiraceae bacterium]|nr:hypothetical protein [Oscillospiraceae bacterium]